MTEKSLKKSDELNLSEYSEFLSKLKSQIQKAQVRAISKVNRELVLLYWQIGNEILQRQKEKGWGAKVIERLSKDLRNEFPEMKGFSTRNLKYMRILAETYNNEEFVQQAVAQIPWGHNVRILDKVKNPEEREFYIRQTIENGWSRNILVVQIESKLFERQGQAQTNFERTLPKPQSDLANQLLKDPYNFDFLTIGLAARESELESNLLQNIKDFLPEF
jgi:predicted nuclease of restriction endonuclease-like (RecB) superfamily